MSEKRRYSALSTTSISLASAVLGALFLVNNANTVHAATENQVTPTLASQNQKDKQQSAPTPNAETLKVKKDQPTQILAVKKDQTDHDQSNAKTDKELVLTPEEEKAWDSYQFPKLSAEQEDQLEEILGIKTSEISTSRLKELGLDANTYLHNGVKSKIYSTWQISFAPINDEKKPKVLAGGEFTQTHAQNGDAIFVDAMKHEGLAPWDSPESFGTLYDFMENNLNFPEGLNITPIINVDSKLAPLLQGKTLYINKDDKFSPEDTKRGFKKEFTDAFKIVKFDDEINRQNQVDTKGFNHKAGVYNVAIDATYQNDASVSGAVKVVVVDLKGKTITVNVGDQVSNKPEDYITGAPAGSTMKWIAAQPTSSIAGSFSLPVEVTYPDGTKGKTTATLIVKNADTANPLPSPEPVPDPVPEPQPLPQPIPVPEPSVPTDEDEQKIDIPKPLATDDPAAPTAAEKTTNHKAVRPLAMKVAVNHPVVARAQTKVAHILPQTGSKNNVLLIVIGGILVSLVSLWLMASAKRKD